MWVVPFPPGGQADTAARVLAKATGDRLGQQVVIENKPGAGGVIGAEIVMNAKPDGYTIFYGSSGPMGILPKLLKNISYDPVKNFAPIAAIAVSPLVLLVPPGKPYKTFKEFADYAKKNPDKLTFSSVGIGSTQHLGGELLALSIGTKMIHVPYKGSAPAVLDLLAGRIDVGFDNYTPNKGNIDAGKLHPARRRSREAPELAAGRADHRRTRSSATSSWRRGRASRRPPARRSRSSTSLPSVFEDITRGSGDRQILQRRGLDRACRACVKDKARDFYVSEGEKFKLLIEKSGATAE